MRSFIPVTLIVRIVITTVATSITSSHAVSVETLPGVTAPLGFFDPLGFTARADERLLQRYREAEVTHGRVAMLASVGFLVGEKVEGSSFLFDASVRGPAITHLTQVPTPFWTVLVIFITNAELYRARRGFVEPLNVPIDQPGLLRDDYIPGDLAFDPLGLAPKEPGGFYDMQTKELQNGRLAMIAAAGFMAQELVDGKGIMEHLQLTSIAAEGGAASVTTTIASI